MTEKVLEIFQSPTRDTDVKWRTDLATERQIARLQEIMAEGGHRIPKGLTKGQASDAIGMFEEPEEEELEQLRFFKVPDVGSLSQTEARWALQSVFETPGNAEKWASRPATAAQKDQIKFFSGTVAKGLIAKDAAQQISDLEEANPELYDRWDNLRSAYDELVEREAREDFDIKKFTWAQFHSVVTSLEKEGLTPDSIATEDERVYEALIAAFPGLAK